DLPTSRRFGGWFRRYDKPMEQTVGRTERKILQASGHTGSVEGRGQRDTKLGGGKTEAPQWDVAPPQEFFDELFRISRNQIIWGGNYFSLPPTRCFLVWKKHIPEAFSMAMCEYAWTSFTGNAKVFEYSSLRGKHSGKFHPTEKPLELYGWIYRNYVKDGETVFDPMMGSQASRIAAYKMGIDYVGCEIDKYYYDKGCEWFERECHGITKTASGKTIIEQTLFEL
ncbi:MAG: DNA methyltransferase, partial [Prevotella pectinovora]